MRLGTIKLDISKRLVACVDDQKLIDLNLAAQDAGKSSSLWFEKNYEQVCGLIC